MENEPNAAMMDDEADKQKAMFIELKKYNLTDDLNHTTDYFLVDTIGGVSYYSPNDEDWGCVIAVDEVNELAVNTGFFETADFEDIEYGNETIESDYRLVFHDGKLKCKFQTE